MKIIGLTGGIGMGKSTAAGAFRRARLPVYDADAVVRRLQAPGGLATKLIDAAFPGTVMGGVLNRAALRSVVAHDISARRRLEAIVHPLVRAQERAFLASARRNRAKAVLLDIPLLLETRGDTRVDIVVVVSAPRNVQEARLRKRGNLGAAEIAAFIAAQMPDREKRRRADVIVRTGLSKHETQRQMRRLIRKLLS